MARRLLYMLVVALAAVLPGCSYLCHFEIRGAVRDAADGRPIPNACVELLNADGRRLLEGRADAHEAHVMTNPQGEFQAAFRTVPMIKEELTGWTMKLSAEGYEPETIEVGSVNEPKRDDLTVYLIFHASMRKAR